VLLADALRYKAWADRRICAAVTQLTGDANPSTMAFVCQQLNHMVRVEELFRARLAGTPEPHTSTNTTLVEPFKALEARLVSSNQWLLNYIGTATRAQLKALRHFMFTDGQRGTLSCAEILFHLINHGSYHRGAIGHALAAAGAHRPADTYTVFIHAEQPARRFGAFAIGPPQI
jgi:uncharacterized damage-inducible protein DinB